MSVFAAESDDALTASLNEAKEYIHSITLDIPVTVENVHVVKTELTTPSGAVVVGAASTVHTGGKLSITYSDGTMENVDVSVGMIENASTAKEGIYENLPVEIGVDVILVADLSNSMAWKIGNEDTSGTSTDDGNPLDANGNYLFEESKFYSLQKAVSSFANMMYRRNRLRKISACSSTS